MIDKESMAIMAKDPILYFDHVLQAPHWSKQDEIIESVFKNQRTTVKSCHGVGKSYVSARIGIAFLATHEDSIVITTAPTFRQVTNIIWREWRNAIAKAKARGIIIPGNVMKTQHEISNKWYALGVSADKDDNFQGYHAKYILVIVDEAAGIDVQILNATEALLTSKNVRLLYIGNPTCSSGNFYNSHKSEFFHKISINVFQSPNFRANKILDVETLGKFTKKEIDDLPLVYPELVTPSWAWHRLKEWGEKSPMFQARVMAHFPEEGEDTLIGLAEVSKAMEKEFTDKEILKRPNDMVIGVDVARFGSDKTVFTVMHDLEQIEMDWHTGKDTMETVGKTIALFNQFGMQKEFHRIVVDDTGVGGGVSDRLKELGYDVVKINFGESSSDKEKFVNIKAEIFWHLKTIFQQNKIKILDKGKLISQLPTIRYEYTSRGQIAIVSKDAMKKKGLDSPDFADSMALAVRGLQRGSNVIKEIQYKQILESSKGGIGMSGILLGDDDDLEGEIF